MLKFYYAKNSAAYAPHILLEDIGADYEAVLIDFKAGEQRGPQLSGGQSKRPIAVACDRQRRFLTETLAILVYLAQTHPEHGLIPADPFEFAEAQAFNSYMASTVHVAHAHKHRGHRWADDLAARNQCAPRFRKI